MPRIHGLHNIAGLHLFTDFVMLHEERNLLKRALVPTKGAIAPARIAPIGQERQRVERYGKTVYKTGNVSAVIPHYLYELCERIYARGYTSDIPNSVSINEYRAGQGLVHHVDNADGGEEIAILGLGADATMEMVEVADLNPRRVTFTIPARGLLLMADDARWAWTHSVLPVKATRISLVFRHANRP